MTTQAKKPFVVWLSKRASWVWVILAILVSAVLAWFLVTTIDSTTETTYPAILSDMVSEAVRRLATGAVLLAFVGSVLCAVAHGVRDDRRTGVTDFVGKLFTVSATTLPVWGVLISESAESGDFARFTIFVAVAALTAEVVLVFLLIRQHLRKKNGKASRQ